MIVETKGLKKYYGEEPNIVRALDGVDFSVEEGEFVAVVGTSAAANRRFCTCSAGWTRRRQGASWCVAKSSRRWTTTS